MRKKYYCEQKSRSPSCTSVERLKALRMAIPRYAQWENDCFSDMSADALDLFEQFVEILENET